MEEEASAAAAAQAPAQPPLEAMAQEPRRGGRSHAEILRQMIASSRPSPAFQDFGASSVDLSAIPPDSLPLSGSGLTGFDAPESFGAASDPDFAPAAAGGALPDRLAAVALGRAADRLYGLPVYIETVEQAMTTPDELSELFPERALLAIVHGHGDRLGVVALCPSLIASLIEMQAAGRVSSRPLRARRPTRTDAAIAADFVNRLLVELGQDLGTQPGQPDFASFTYASYLDDSRPLMLMLEDAALQRLTLRFRIGAGGQRDAELILALPPTAVIGFDGNGLPALPFAEEVGDFMDLPAMNPILEAGSADSPSDFPPASLADAVREAPLTLKGVLCRREMTLRALRNLQIGDLIPLPAGVLDTARIETQAGQLLALGRLGEAEGLHAIRLHAAAEGMSALGQPSPGLADTAPGASGVGVVSVDLEAPDDFRDASGFEAQAFEAGTPNPFPAEPLIESDDLPSFANSEILSAGDWPESGAL